MPLIDPSRRHLIILKQLFKKVRHVVLMTLAQGGQV